MPPLWNAMRSLLFWIWIWAWQSHSINLCICVVQNLGEDKTLQVGKSASVKVVQMMHQHLALSRRYRILLFLLIKIILLAAFTLPLYQPGLSSYPAHLLLTVFLTYRMEDGGGGGEGLSSTFEKIKTSKHETFLVKFRIKWPSLSLKHTHIIFKR